MTTHPTRHIRRCTAKEERPAVLLLARLGQLLEVEHLAKWHSCFARQREFKIQLEVNLKNLIQQ